MEERICEVDRDLSNAAALAAAVSTDNFGMEVLDFVSQTATIRNLSVFYFPDLAHPEPVQSVWSRRIGDYWMRRHGVLIANTPEMIGPVIEDIRAAPTTGVRIGRWHPQEGDPLKPLFVNFGVRERVTVASRGRRFGYQGFFLRDEADGWLSDEEFRGLCEILPYVHTLIGLRYRLAGLENIRLTTGASVTGLRERSVMKFSDLSKREAQVCDSLVSGLSIAGTALELGIAKTTVRTLRQRAYRKLDVNSATQLMGLIVHHTKLD